MNDTAHSTTMLKESAPLSFSPDATISGSKAIRSNLLRAGLTLIIYTPTPGTPLKDNFDMDDAPVQFGFTYSGKNRCTYSGGTLHNRTHEMESGSNGIFHFPKTHGTIEKSKEDPAHVIGLAASPGLLLSYFADSMDQFPKAFQKNLNGNRQTPMAWFGPSSPSKQHLLSQILNCPYKGGMRTLFLESRALELLTLQIHDYSLSETKHRPMLPTLSPSDVERVRHARDILVQDLENPPRLTELALKAGVNERKLKNGFRQIFATSVFGYFREQRMQKAYELLQQGDHNVTEAAFAVGYQSLSHFSQAFKERFGILPKTFVAQQNRLRTS